MRLGCACVGAMVTTGGEVRVVEVYISGGGPGFVDAARGLELVTGLLLLLSSANVGSVLVRIYEK